MTKKLLVCSLSTRRSFTRRLVGSGGTIISSQLWAILVLSPISYLPSARAQTTALEQTAARKPATRYSESVRERTGAASKPRMSEPLEQPALPPAYIRRLETAPHLRSRLGLCTGCHVR